MSATNSSAPFANMITADTLSESDMTGPANDHHALDALVDTFVREIEAAENGTLSVQQCMLGIRAAANKAKVLLKTYREPYKRRLRGANRYIDHLSNVPHPTERDLALLNAWCKESKDEFAEIGRNVEDYEELAGSYQDKVWHRFVVVHKGFKLWELHDCLSNVEVSLMSLLDVVKDTADAFRDLNKIRQMLRRHLSGVQVNSGNTGNDAESQSSDVMPPSTKKQDKKGAGSQTKDAGNGKARQQDGASLPKSDHSLAAALSQLRLPSGTVKAATWIEHNQQASESDVAKSIQPTTIAPVPAGPPPSIPNSLAMLEVISLQAPTHTQSSTAGLSSSIPSSLAMLEVVAPQASIQPQPLAAGGSFSTIEEKLHGTGAHRRAATTQPAGNNYTAGTSAVGPPQLGSVIRRSGRSVPRIFTGSFDELERGLHDMPAASAPAQIVEPSHARLFPEEPKIRVNVRDFADPQADNSRPVNLQMHNGKILARRHNARTPVQDQTIPHAQTAQMLQRSIEKTSDPQSPPKQKPVTVEHSKATMPARVLETALHSAPVSHAGTRASSPRLPSRHRENTI